ncbi:C40 family peptidase [Wenjunlia tyrosinilytica]|uniref:Glycoside hydrolase n=1 Tax=Wenjunlia tyrosinilytica TaxID=1544741 RepID=A0A917ZU72_9ACTN|nr:C40 family peptidase [Wenjunlia tyrosinilytica]GGO92042.1 glycoside hydrolase [Wenjunlia tyrosinilytica]
MATHRKPRPALFASPGTRAAAGLTTAALATVTLLSETANAAPAKATVKEVKAQVDELYHQAESATQRYNGAMEKTKAQRQKVNRLLDEVAEQADSLNQARRKLGEYAAEQYRTGGVGATAELLLAKDPQAYFDQTHIMTRLGNNQRHAVEDFQDKQANTARKRLEASRSLGRLTKAQRELAVEKRTVQDKLGKARKLLARLTAEERARLKELERKKAAEALERAKKLEQERKAREAAENKAQQSGGSDSGSGGGTGDSGTSGGSQTTQAAKAVAFARAQLGKPYVWGATGPNSYDCSGLTQAAWKAAGVSLPRTTWDQVKAGRRVSTSQLKPGDLIFFYNDISHVGMYIGNGRMIHAPKPGDTVKIAPITEMPIYGNVRPA